MNKIILHQRPVWSPQTAARARLAGWVFCYDMVEPLPVETGLVPGDGNLPLPSHALVVALPAIKIPLIF
jgi:hypothetical protein